MDNQQAMNFSRLNSVRLVVDLQACQTVGSAQRGVGRYSQSLFGGIAKEAASTDVRAVLSSALTHEPSLSAILPTSILRLPGLPDWPTPRSYRAGHQDDLDSLAYSAMVAAFKPDVLHVSHSFEGFNERVALPAPGALGPAQVLSATLYDLIPLVFQDHYFQNEEFRKWYLNRLGWLRKADLLLAISESSRQDAINHLGINPDRIVTVHGGVGAHFSVAADRNTLKESLVARYRLKQRFVLYTGGDDHRKNLAGAIRGFAQVPSRLRTDCQLVLVCAMDQHRRETYMDIARVAGLQETDVVITGYVPEDDLLAFYQTCDVFVFPSLYEGLGLPVLEAMACGAPVIGGNNSSIRELIGRGDALFDSASASSIAAVMAKALTDTPFRDELGRFGLDKVKQFSWERTTGLALAAFSDALERKQVAGVNAAVSGWVPRKRLAMLSPLPPCRSGIADYNARFLPFLARHFDIDLYVNDYEVLDDTLTSAFPILPVSGFDQAASNYDVILYEFGNSEFHIHMLPLLDKYPGVVGMHDAYLSGMFGYLEYFLNDSGSYAREMIRSHGPLARRHFAPLMADPDPNLATMVGLPGTKYVLDRAIGVISHSAFNLDISRSFYPEGWAAPYRTIPQMVPLPVPWPKSRLAEERGSLGFGPDDVVIATFGHVVWTKWGDRLLQAFLHSDCASNARIHLLYVGELAKDAFGESLLKAITDSGLQERIQITGFLPQDGFEKYLRVCDVAIQLRTKSRGGTPKGVLDCLAHGVPVIVNDDASYRDYPPDVVVKLPANPTIEQIASVLDDISGDKTGRTRLTDAGRAYVSAHNDPAQCAAQYAAALLDFAERQALAQPESAIPGLARHIAICNDPSAATTMASDWLAAIPVPQFRRPRIVIDVSMIVGIDLLTGIQRVVREIVIGLYCSPTPGFEPVAVALQGGELRVATAWLDSMGLISAQEKAASTGEAPPVALQPGDILFMLDSSWARYREFFPHFEIARSLQVPIYTVVYDLLPILLPPGNIVDGGKEWFTDWVNTAIASSDGIICISRAVATDIQNHMASLEGLARRPRVGYWHLGSDVDPRKSEGPISKAVLAMAGRPYLLMVGTIEPRKSHAAALDIMESLWKDGCELALCIAGKEGWMVTALLERLRSHELRGIKLFLFEGPTDAEVNMLYEQASALLFLSKGEGFGLPLVEAANHGTPIICSDLPVFREIAGDYATYVDHNDVGSAKSDIAEWWNKRKAGVEFPTAAMPRFTWEQSCAALLEVLFGKKWI